MKKKHIWKNAEIKSSKLKMEDLIKKPDKIIKNLTKMNQLVNEITNNGKIENFNNIETISQWKETALRLLPKNISKENLVLVKDKLNDILFYWRKND
jgi:hypothetical protein